MHKLPKRQFWYCWCGRTIFTNDGNKLATWLQKHLGLESRCQKYRSFSPIWWYNAIILKINNWYWAKKITIKSVIIDETGVTSRKIKS